MMFSVIFACLGSSPRVWGQVFKQQLLLPYLRIIPTRVGTRGRLYLCQRRKWDHPHACGDKTNKYYTNPFAVGSSPRVWGQGRPYRHCRCTLRIIPTRVGTSRIKVVFTAIYQDHPHACGDKSLYTLKPLMLIGSSPRVWGQET